MTPPAFARRTPVTILNRVDLPEPFGPTRPVISPAWQPSVHPLSAATPPNHLVTPSISRSMSTARPRRRAPADLADDAIGHEEHQRDDRQAEDELVDDWELRPERLRDEYEAHG